MSFDGMNMVLFDGSIKSIEEDRRGLVAVSLDGLVRYGVKAHGILSRSIKVGDIIRISGRLDDEGIRATTIEVLIHASK